MTRIGCRKNETEMSKTEIIMEFAREKLNEHKLQDEWTLVLTRGKKIAGYCDERTKVIGLSGILINARSLENSKNTVLHEIAHAIVGCDQGHNKAWQRIAKLIGAKPERCFNTTEIDKSKIQYKYTGICPNCGKTSDYSRKLKRRKSCGVCCPTHFNPEFEIVITQNY